MTAGALGAGKVSEWIRRATAGKLVHVTMLPKFKCRINSVSHSLSI